jgi:hypothetical protein
MQSLEQSLVNMEKRLSFRIFISISKREYRSVRSKEQFSFQFTSTAEPTMRSIQVRKRKELLFPILPEIE